MDNNHINNHGGCTHTTLSSSAITPKSNRNRFNTNDCTTPQTPRTRIPKSPVHHETINDASNFITKMHERDQQIKHMNNFRSRINPTNSPTTETIHDKNQRKYNKIVNISIDMEYIEFVRSMGHECEFIKSPADMHLCYLNSKNDCKICNEWKLLMNKNDHNQYTHEFTKHLSCKSEHHKIKGGASWRGHSTVHAARHYIIECHRSLQEEFELRKYTVQNIIIMSNKLLPSIKYIKCIYTSTKT